MKFNLKADVLLIGTALVFAGVALDRGIHFVNWNLIAMGMSGEQMTKCPADTKQQASPSITPPSPNSGHPLASPQLPIPLRNYDVLPATPISSAKPAKTETQGKEKEEPAVTVDLSAGRKGSETSSAPNTPTK